MQDLKSNFGPPKVIQRKNQLIGGKWKFNICSQSTQP